MIKKTNFYILSGGPGSGKSTLIDELVIRRQRCIPEVARVIIQEQMARGGSALPWGDTQLYSKLMMERSKKDFDENAHSQETIFFDRGIPDVIGYMNLIGLKIPSDFHDLARDYQYHQRVFMLPPWKEIYQNDTERKQTFDEAVATYEALSEAYRSLNYSIVEIPKLSVAQRADFLLANF